jgi:hypothetical protein
MKVNKWYAIGIFIIILALSMLKDELTPDYRNTPAALFLSPEQLTESRAATLFTHTLFWIKAFGYSSCFVLLPTLLIHFAFKQVNLSKFTLVLHIAITVLLYVSIFIQSTSIDHVLVSKVNRYLHSPIITLFLWAAFTITQLQSNNEPRN